MFKDIYSRPMAFAALAAAVILIGTGVTMFYPMFTDQMHPKLDGLKTPSPLELAGRDLYQREGCNNCHSQTVRPLKTEVMRYGEYSKAGEYAYDRPFLWGSKRTGPDLARIAGKYPDKWHLRHFADPRAFFAKSNMPSYAWMADNPVDIEQTQRNMDALGYAYNHEEIEVMKGQNELDALTAYMQYIGRAVKTTAPPKETVKGGAGDLDLQAKSPVPVEARVEAAGEKLYAGEECLDCHGEDGVGDIGPALNDLTFLGKEGDVADGYYFKVIHDGTESGFPLEGFTSEGGMPPYGTRLSTEEIWTLVSLIRWEQAEHARGEE